SLRPFRAFDAEKVGQYFLDRNVSAVFAVLVDGRLPWVVLITVGLLFSRLRHHRGVSQPPRRAGVEQRHGLGPQLVAVTFDSLAVDCSTPDRPEASRAGFVLEIEVGIGAADEDRLPRHLDDAATVARPEAVDLTRDESLHALDLTAGHGGQLGYF